MRQMKAIAIDAGKRELADALIAAGLPVADLAEPGRTFFRFEAGEGVVGFGGLEGEGADLLVRSLVVTGTRGEGTGGRMLAALEAEARARGAERLHLLTKGAASFFERHGYAPAERKDAPAAIARSAQFAGICPASADYLAKRL